MTVHAEKVGRNLHLRFEGIEEPFVIKPLPGRAGVQITDTYLQAAGGSTADIIAAMQIAVDGGRQNAITGRWEPLPEEEQTNHNRIGNELSQSESESILL